MTKIPLDSLSFIVILSSTHTPYINPQTSLFPLTAFFSYKKWTIPTNTKETPHPRLLKRCSNLLYVYLVAFVSTGMAIIIFITIITTTTTATTGGCRFRPTAIRLDRSRDVLLPRINPDLVSVMILKIDFRISFLDSVAMDVVTLLPLISVTMHLVIRLISMKDMMKVMLMMSFLSGISPLGYRLLLRNPHRLRLLRRER